MSKAEKTQEQKVLNHVEEVFYRHFPTIQGRALGAEEKKSHWEVKFVDNTSEEPKKFIVQKDNEHIS